MPDADRFTLSDLRPLRDVAGGALLRAAMIGLRAALSDLGDDPHRLAATDVRSMRLPDALLSELAFTL